MSDHGAAPDPIDEAYARAEALLSDEAARAARRERVLAAVAREPAAAAVAAAPSRRWPAWRRGGWLAAACAAGLSLFVVSQVYEPVPRQPRTPPAAPAAATTPPATTPTSAAPAPAAPTPVAPTSAPARGHPAAPAPFASAPKSLPPPPAAMRAPAPAAPPANIPAPAPPPAALPIAPPLRAFPAAPPPPESPVVAAERRESARAADSAKTRPVVAEDVVTKAQGGLTQQSARQPASESLATAPSPQSRFGSFAARPFDPAARLRDAAAAGRTAEVETLLDQGAPVDAPDADGNTALIKSVQADHPAAAAALSRHGASLDHKNRAGESARDIAAAKDDAALNQAIGVGP